MPEGERCEDIRPAHALTGYHMSRTMISVANHGSQDSGAEVTRGVNGVSRLQTERDTNSEERKEKYEWNKPSRWSDILLVSGSENANYKYGSAQKLTTVL